MRKKIKYIIAVSFGIFLFHFLYSVLTARSIADKWAYSVQPSFASIYFEQQNYMIGLSYALAGFMTVYAVMKFKLNKKQGAKGLIGGITLTGLLYTGSCFLLGCCGSPMLAVYLSLFGSSFLGFTKPLTLILTSASVIVGFVFIEKKTKNKNACCSNEEEGKGDACYE